jgi:methionyl-tRNA synthetase
MKTFYVTTPIYYVNDVPHIGHAYTTIAADVLARYRRLCGFEVLFLTGTDEHGKKVEEAAQEADEKPIQLADRVVRRFQELWAKLTISHDDFIRTSEKRHYAVVQDFYRAVKEKGDIYLGEYEDWYCVPCETFWTENQLVDGRCPNPGCSRPTEKLKEESYFFRMSRYQEPLLKHIEEHPDFIQPPSRRNEIVSFVKEGLRDLSISRASFSWGIPVPDDSRHIIYVWFDALVNYLTGSGYLEKRNQFDRFWPADVHLIGKDILRFHTVYWPTFLMSAGMPLPKRVFAHGWWTVEGQKMSKSLGNVIDPGRLVEEYGVDPVRYFLLREVPFGLDGDFSRKALVQRINSDLANDLGNLFSRTIAMGVKYFRGEVRNGRVYGEVDGRLRERVGRVVGEVDTAVYVCAFNSALVSLWDLIGVINKYLDETAPWRLSKDQHQSGRLATVLYNTFEALRIVTLLLYPFMPTMAVKMWDALGIQKPLEQEGLHQAGEWGRFGDAFTVRKIPPLFPRIEP